MEQTRKFAVAGATLRRLGHWAAATRAIGAHLAGATRLLTPARHASSWSEPTAASQSNISSKSAPHDRSSIDRFAAGLHAIIARVPGVVRAGRVALSSPINPGPGAKPAAAAGEERQGTVKGSNPKAVSGRTDDGSAREPMLARAYRRLGAFPGNRSALGDLAGWRRTAESAGTPSSKRDRAPTSASHDDSPVDRTSARNAIAGLASRSNQGTLERAAATLQTTEAADRFLRPSGSSVATPDAGGARPDRWERARPSEGPDHPLRPLTGTPSLATPLAGSSRRAGSRHLVSAPRGMASLYGFETRLAAPDRIASAQIPVFPPALGGGNDRTPAASATAFAGPRVVINSSPTIVINEAHGADLEGRVLDALRHHGGELYAQWQREAGRRQRTEF